MRRKRFWVIFVIWLERYPPTCIDLSVCTHAISIPNYRETLGSSTLSTLSADIELQLCDVSASAESHMGRNRKKTPLKPNRFYSRTNVLQRLKSTPIQFAWRFDRNTQNFRMRQCYHLKNVRKNTVIYIQTLNQLKYASKNIIRYRVLAKLKQHYMYPIMHWWFINKVKINIGYKYALSKKNVSEKIIVL